MIYDPRTIKGTVIGDSRVEINKNGLTFSEDQYPHSLIGRVWFSLDDAIKLRDFLVEHLPVDCSATVESEADEESLDGKPSEFLYTIREEG